MNVGLVRKSMREAAPLTIIAGCGLLAVEFLFASILPTFYKDMADTILKLPFARKIIPAALGLNPDQAIGPAMMTAIVWIHPVVLALVWIQAIAAGTRIPAGEIDRGTIDIVLSMPVSRTSIFLTEAIVGLLGGTFVITMGLAGNVAGGWSLETELLGSIPQRLWVVANLWAVFATAFGMAALASSVSDRRGRAVAVVVSVLVGMFVVGFLSAYSPALKKILFLSVLNYYRPLFVLQNGVRPVGDITLLLVAATVLWVLGWLFFIKRDIRTV